MHEASGSGRRREVAIAVVYEPWDAARAAEIIAELKTREGATLVTGTPQRLTNAGVIGSTGSYRYVPSVDGRRFLVREDPRTVDVEVEPIHMILNWPSLLTK